MKLGIITKFQRLD